MKKLILFTTFLGLLLNTSFAQEKAKEAFQIRMNNHVSNYIDKELDMTKAKELYGHTCDKHHIVTEAEIKAQAAEAEKHAYIQANMAEYMKLYFPETNNRSVLTDTFICDNGGFEDDFLYYRGYVSTYTSGSTTCSPTVNGNPVTWTPITMPTFRRFQIVNSGNDPLVGIDKTKFGNKSLKINNELGHNANCAGSFGIDRLIKRFKVTSENREFTLWYAVVLENPAGHVNQQPFFSIKCDLAPNNDLCFDAEILRCAQIYENNCEYDSIDVLDWTCHRIKIPSSEVGNIATLEILMADCGAGAHFGYAYIDGFCEECSGSSLGSGILYNQIFDGEIGIEYPKCDEDTVATICGRYTLPSICNDVWNLDSVKIANYPSISVSIDTLTKTFCFDFYPYLFSQDDCMKLFAELYFSSTSNSLPTQYSNEIELCLEDLSNFQYEAIVSQCYDNGTIDNLSDDYYFVNLTIGSSSGMAWLITRQLLDPYPNESGFQNLISGAGNTNIQLGPFLIQEGAWNLNLSFPICEFNEIIDPPAFCSGCDKFYDLEIANVQCRNATTPNTWRFDLVVPGSGLYNVKIFGGGTVLSGVSYNSLQTIIVGDIDTECITYEISDKNDPTCVSYFTVCPPKPCGESINCNLEVSVVKKECIDKNGDFTVTLDTLFTGSGYVCYTTDDFATTSPMPSNGVIGPFSQDITLVVFICPYANCKDCSNPACFKVIQIFQPDCESGHFGNGGLPKLSNIDDSKHAETLKVVPNPVDGNILRITSTLNQSEIEIYNISSQLIHKTRFDGSEYSWNMAHLPSGIYILKYRDKNQKSKTIKFVK